MAFLETASNVFLVTGMAGNLVPPAHLEGGSGFLILGLEGQLVKCVPCEEDKVRFKGVVGAVLMAELVCILEVVTASVEF